MPLEKRQIRDADRLAPSDRSDDARYRVRVTTPIKGSAGVVKVDTLERGGVISLDDLLRAAMFWHHAASDSASLGQHGFAVALAQAIRGRHHMTFLELKVVVGQRETGERQNLARGLAVEDGRHLLADQPVLLVEHGTDDQDLVAFDYPPCHAEHAA